MNADPEGEKDGEGERDKEICRWGRREMGRWRRKESLREGEMCRWEVRVTGKICRWGRKERRGVYMGRGESE